MEIVLHLGAHKTASTYLQMLLRRNEDLLRTQGVLLCSPEDLRAGQPSAAARLLKGLTGSRRHPVYDQIALQIQKAQGARATRLIISEENLIGHLNKLLLGSWCYTNVEQRLTPLWPLLQGHKITVLLAVRNYATYLPTAYGQALRGGKFVPFDEALHGRLTSLSQGWFDLVQQVWDSLPPGARLTAWQYEELGELEPRILAEFVGDGLAMDLNPIKQRPQPGPTRRAIKRLHAINLEEGSLNAERIKKVMRFNSRSKGYEPFDPWSEGERAQLDWRYRQDIARISMAYPGVLLHPPPQEMPLQSGVSM